MANLITGLFDTESAAESAVARLKEIGYGSNEITIIMKDRHAAAELAADTGSKTMEGIGAGAAIGGTLGAIVGGLLAIGSVTIPGVGLIVGGSLAAMLAGAGTGGLAGSLIGGLVSMGIPEDLAPYYERGLGEGGIVVAVSSHPGDEARVQQVLSGGSVAYAGSNMGYVQPQYASRFTDMPKPTAYDRENYDAYHHDNTRTDMADTVNDMNAEARTEARTTDTNERNAEREAQDQTRLDDFSTAVVNTVDSTTTAAKNQADKVMAGVGSTADRTSQP